MLQGTRRSLFFSFFFFSLSHYDPHLPASVSLSLVVPAGTSSALLDGLWREKRKGGGRSPSSAVFTLDNLGTK